MRNLSMQMRNLKGDIGAAVAGMPLIDPTKGVLKFVKPVSFPSTQATVDAFKYNTLLTRQVQKPGRRTHIPSYGVSLPEFDLKRAIYQPLVVSDIQGDLSMPVFGSDALNDATGRVGNRAQSLMLQSRPLKVPASGKIWFGLSLEGTASISSITVVAKAQWDAVPSDSRLKAAVLTRFGDVRPGAVFDPSPGAGNSDYATSTWHPKTARFTDSVPTSAFGFIQSRPKSSSLEYQSGQLNANGGVADYVWNADNADAYNSDIRCAVDFNTHTFELPSVASLDIGLIGYGNGVQHPTGSTYSWSTDEEFIVVFELSNDCSQQSTCISTANTRIQCIPFSTIDVLGWEDPNIVHPSISPSLIGAKTYRAGRPLQYSPPYPAPWRMYSGLFSSDSLSVIPIQGMGYVLEPTQLSYFEIVGPTLQSTDWQTWTYADTKISGRRIGISFDPATDTQKVWLDGLEVAHTQRTAGQLQLDLDLFLHYTFGSCVHIYTKIDEIKNLPAAHTAWLI